MKSAARFYPAHRKVLAEPCHDDNDQSGLICFRLFRVDKPVMPGMFNSVSKMSKGVSFMIRERGSLLTVSAVALLTCCLGMPR